MMTNYQVVDEISYEKLMALYDRFLNSISLHGWHRTQVKRSLTKQLIELFADDVNAEKAAIAVNKLPYNKERFWRDVFLRLVAKFNYRHCVLHTVNSGIIGRIQYDVMVNAV